MDIFVHPLSVSNYLEEKESFKNYKKSIISILEVSKSPILLTDSLKSGNNEFKLRIDSERIFETERIYTQYGFISTGKIKKSDFNRFKKLTKKNFLRFHGIDPYYCVSDAIFSTIYNDTFFRIPLKAYSDLIKNNLTKEKIKYGILFTSTKPYNRYLTTSLICRTLLEKLSDNKTELFS